MKHALGQEMDFVGKVSPFKYKNVENVKRIKLSARYMKLRIL